MDFMTVRPWVARLMCDSENLAALLPTPVIATYSDLITSEAMRDDLQGHFPNSDIVLGDRGLGDPTGRSSWADCERWAMTPDDLPAWHDRQQAADVADLTVYASYNRYARVDAVMAGRDFYRWVAFWGHLEVPRYPWAIIQFADSGMIGADVDLSYIANPQWRARPAPVVAP